MSARPKRKMTERASGKLPPRAGLPARWGVYLLLLLLALLAAPIPPLINGYHRRETAIVHGLPPHYLGGQQPALGVNADLTRYRDDDALRAALDKIVAAQIGLVRLRLPWYNLETAPGQYAWGKYDRVIAAAHRRGLRILALLDGTPPWLRPAGEADNLVTPPADFAAFAHFAGTVAHRYAGQIEAYQIWDQPNVTPFWGNRHVDAAGYVRLLSQAAAAIRQADPAALILSAGLAPTTLYTSTAHDDVRYLQEMYDAGVAGHFDVLGAKAYHIDDNNGGLNLTRLLRLHQVMAVNGDNAKAIWAVGWGCHATPPGWQGDQPIWPTRSETAQAACARADLQRKWTQWPWLGVLIWDQFQPAIPQDDPLWGFALLRSDGTPRPVYTTLQEVAAEHTIGSGAYNPTAWFWHGNATNVRVWGEKVSARADQLTRLRWYRPTGQSGEITLSPGETVLLWQQAADKAQSVTLQADPAPPTLFVSRDLSPWPLQLASLFGDAALIVLLALCLLFWRHPAWRHTITVGVAVIAAIFVQFAPGTGWAALPLLFLLLATLYDFELALFLAVFSVPFAWQVHPLAGLLISPLELFWALALLSGGLRFLMNLGRAEPGRWRRWPALAWRWLRPTHALDGAMLFLLIAGALATVTALRKDVAPHQFKITIIEPVVFYWLLRSSARWPDSRAAWAGRRWHLVHALLLAGGSVVLIGFYQYALHPAAFLTEGVFRMRAVYGSPNNLGLFLGRLLPLAVALWIAPLPRSSAGLWPRWRYLVMVVLIGLGLLLSASRGALLIGVPLSLLFILVYGGKKARWPVIGLLLAELIGLIPFLGTSRASGGTLTRRLYVWRAAIRMLHDHPLGIGPDNFLYLFSGRYLPYPDFPEPSLSHPHDIILHFWLALGLPGLIALGWIVGALYRLGRSLLALPRDNPSYWLALGLLAALVDFFGHGLVDSAYFLPDLAMQFVFIGALLSILSEFEVEGTR